MKFKYLARTKPKGKKQIGSVEAKRESSAVKILHGDNLIVVKIKKTKEILPFLREIKILNRVKRQEIMIFCRQLSILVGTEVPLVQSLRALGEQIKSSYFKEIILKIAADVDGGMLFSEALAKYPKVFSVLFINLIKSGEVSGRLNESLDYLAKYLEKEYYLISKIRGAMIYPAFILTTFLIVGVLMMIMVVPGLTDILKETGQELPLTTKVLIGVSDFLKTKGWILGLVSVFLIIGFWYFIKTSFGRGFLDGLKLKLPILGGIFQKIYIARFSESLGTLIKGGLPIIQALNVSGEVVGNTVFREIILEAVEGVKVGQSLSSVLIKYDQFPPTVVQMIKTGEKTGNLDYILENLAGFYSREVDNVVASLSQLIEPVLIIILGVMVAILVSAILLPIYNIAGGIE